MNSRINSSGYRDLKLRHGLEGSARCSHGHLASIAMFSHLRMGIPNSLVPLGRAHGLPCHRTLTTISPIFPHHKKPLHILVMAKSVFCGISSASIVCIGITHSTDYTRNITHSSALKRSSSSASILPADPPIPQIEPPIARI